MQHVNFCISENEFLEFLTSSQLEPFVNKLISEKSKVTCSYCFESFICIKRHRCKVKNGVLSNIFPFSDDLFSAPNKLDKSIHSNYLDAGFTEDGDSINVFEHEVLNFLSDYRSKFAIGYLNIYSVFDKFCDVKFILNNQLLDIFVIAESKLDNSIVDEDFGFIHYNLNRRDHTRHGGGLMLYVKKILTITFIKLDPSFETIELLFETRKSEKVALLACYRQFNSEGFLNSVEEKVMNLEGTIDDIIIAGDFNSNIHLYMTFVTRLDLTMSLRNLLVSILLL